jgi:type VI secretion system protein ImpG
VHNFDLPSRFQIWRGERATSMRWATSGEDGDGAAQADAERESAGGQGHFWRLISLLSLNYLSLNEEGRSAMQEILRLHN